MGQRDDDFTQVLSRLRAVRDELASTSSPERVGVLRDLAQELVADGRTLLHRHLDQPGRGEAAGVTAPDGPATPARAVVPADEAAQPTRALDLTGATGSAGVAGATGMPGSPGAGEAAGTGPATDPAAEPARVEPDGTDPATSATARP